MHQCMNCGGPVWDSEINCPTCGLHRRDVIFGEQSNWHPCERCGESVREPRTICEDCALFADGSDSPYGSEEADSDLTAQPLPDGDVDAHELRRQMSIGCQGVADQFLVLAANCVILRGLLEGFLEFSEDPNLQALEVPDIAALQSAANAFGVLKLAVEGVDGNKITTAEFEGILPQYGFVVSPEIALILSNAVDHQ